MVWLDRPRARLERAKVHQSEFGRIWNEFIGHEDDEPYFPRLHIEDDGEGILYVEASERFPGEQLALQFGEMLYQLRAALDSLVYEVAIHDSGSNPPPDADKLEFLIRPSQDSFDQGAWKIKPLSDLHRWMIQSVQPYEVPGRGDGEVLVARTFKELNDLARKDRHRGLRVVTAWVSNKNPIITLPPGASLEWLLVTPDGHLDEYGEVARFKVKGAAPVKSEIEANPNCAFDVTVEDAAPPADDEDTLSARARTMIACISEVIRGFEQTLGV
jgi:hypothetical protein